MLRVAMVIAAVLLSGCAGAGRFFSGDYAPEMQLGLGYETGDPVVGDPPTGLIRLVKPVWVDNNYRRCWVEYEHMSSVPNFYDRNTVDQFNGLCAIRLGPR